MIIRIEARNWRLEAGSYEDRSMKSEVINREKEIKRMLKETKEKIVKLGLHPEVYKYLKEHLSPDGSIS